MKKLLFIVLLFCFNPLALADWTLDNERSQLNFNSVKKCVNTWSQYSVAKLATCS